MLILYYCVSQSSLLASLFHYFIFILMFYKLKPDMCHKHYMCKVYICINERCNIEGNHCKYCRKQFHKNCQVKTHEQMITMIEEIVANKKTQLNLHRLEGMTIDTYINQKKQQIKEEHRKIIKFLELKLDFQRSQLFKVIEHTRLQYLNKLNHLNINYTKSQSRIQNLNYLQKLNKNALLVKFSVNTQQSIQQLRQCIFNVIKMGEPEIKIIKQQCNIRQTIQQKVKNHIKTVESIRLKLMPAINLNKSPNQKPPIYNPIQNITLRQNQSTKNIKQPKVTFTFQKTKKTVSVDRCKQNEHHLNPSPRPSNIKI